MTAAPAPSFLFHRDAEVNEAVRAGRPLYVCRTEAGADAGSAAGLAAVTPVDGWNSWVDGHSERLKGAHVVVLAPPPRQPDPDARAELERRQADYIARSCALFGADARRLDVPHLAPDADLDTWLDGGGDGAAALARLAAAVEPIRLRRRPDPDPATPWAAAVAAPDFLAIEDQDVDYLEARLLVRGHVTALFSPRGLGKTHTALAVAVKLAHAGLRVLLLDRDNAPREVRRRLRRWGALDCPTLKVLTRRHAPPLSDNAAWAQFPTTQYDVVMVDSIDATTEGVGESDSARPSQALARLLDIVRQEDGPAGLLLGNTIKSAAHARGSGVVEDRLDIAYEVRDATGLEPSGTRDWWLELPPAGAEAWGDRASRRKQRDTYRLAFIPSKFRMDQEPEPFVLELDLSGERWTMTDVTADVVQAGEAARAATAAGAQAKAETATTALTAELARREQAGEDPMRTDRDAIPFLMADGLTRKAARQLLAAREGHDWWIEELTRERGRPKVLHSVQPLETGGAGGNGGGNNPPTESRARRGDADRDFRRPLPARPAEMDVTNPAPDAASERPIISAADQAPPGPAAAAIPVVEAEEVDEATAAKIRAALRGRL